jgi:hypothetical protein
MDSEDSTPCPQESTTQPDADEPISYPSHPVSLGFTLILSLHIFLRLPSPVSPIIITLYLLLACV